VVLLTVASLQLKDSCVNCPGPKQLHHLSVVILNEVKDLQLPRLRTVSTQAGRIGSVASLKATSELNCHLEPFDSRC
jgi:hypothetical protein